MRQPKYETVLVIFNEKKDGGRKKRQESIPIEKEETGL